MKTAATIVTVIATALFLLTTAMLSSDAVGRSTKEGTHLFNFMIWYTIPAILWLVYFARSKK